MSDMPRWAYKLTISERNAVAMLFADRRQRDELRERIRELEAELADVKEKLDWNEQTMQGLPEAYRDWKARAEEAEAEARRVPHLVEAVKSRDAEIDQLKAEIEDCRELNGPTFHGGGRETPPPTYPELRGEDRG